MSPSADALLAQAAVARGLLTREQADHALAALAAAPAGVTLAALLARDHAIDPARIDALAPDVAAMKARTATVAGGGITITADAPAPARVDLARSGSDPSTEQRVIATQAEGTHPSSRRSVAQLEGGRFGKYRLDAQVGQGGMGVVYRAFDTEMHRTVAIKVLMGGDEAGPERIRRFQREAETAGKLRHPNIVTIYGVGCEAGHHYFAMDFIEGVDLAHLLAQKTLTLDAALDLFLQVVDAIDCAHRHGVIHRDLKPQNIMVDAARRAYVADFGLAKELTAHTQLTQTGKILGTPMYMAPEQANAEAGKIDTLTDVYALGAVLYEILTGRPPFDGNSPAEIVYSVLFRDPVPPRQIAAGVPQDLETVALKALEKEKSRRYATAGELGEDIKRFRAGEPIRAKPVSSLSRVLRRVRRNRGAVIGVAASLLIGGGALAGGWVWYQRAAGERRAAETQQARVDADRRALEQQQRAREEAAGFLRQAEHEEPARALDLCTRALELDPTSAAARLHRAKVLRKLDRSREAVEELTRALVAEPGNIQALYDRSQLFAWDLHENAKAVADIEELLARDPEHLLALEGQACMLLFQSRNVDATAAFGKVIEKDPSRWGPYYFRACAEAVGGDYGAATADLTAALERKPDDPARLLVDRARYRNFALEGQEALADAEQALRYSPKLAAALIEKALALKLLGRREEALAAAEQAVALAPDHAETIARKAQVHRQFNDFEAALAECNRALALKPECEMALSLRADIWIHQGEYAKAIADCDAILRRSPLWQDAHAARGEALFHLGDLDGALAETTRAIDLRPNEPNGYYMRARIHERLGDHARKQVDVQKHIDLLSARKLDSPAVHVVLGRAHAFAGRIQEAITHFTKAIEREPTLAEAYMNRAALLVQARRLDLAQKDAEKYLELDPGSFDAHRLAALIHLISGRGADAVREYEKAVELKPAGSVEVWNNLAHAYNISGRLDKSVEALERGLALNPTEDGLLYNHACLLGKSGRIAEAIETLGKAIQAGWEHFSHLDEDPDMDILEQQDAFAPTVAEACIERAKSLSETGRSLDSYSPAQAKAEYARAVEVMSLAVRLVDRIASRSLKARTYAQRAAAFRSLRARDKQIVDLEQATGFDSSCESRWRLALGTRDLDEGRPADAVREFTAAIELEPDLAEAWCERGKAKLELGDPAAALEDLEAGLRKRPDLKPYYAAEYRKAGAAK